MLIGYAKATDSAVQSRVNTLPSFTEFWDSESISLSVWTLTSPLVGVGGSIPAIDMTETGYAKVIISEVGVSRDGALTSVKRWRTTPLSTNSIMKKFVMEFELKTGTDVDFGDGSFMGLVGATPGFQGSSNYIGFWNITNIWNAYNSTSSGNVYTDVSSGVTFSNWNKYKIIVGSNKVDYYINEALVSTQTTYIPTTLMYLGFYNSSASIIGTALHVGPIRAYYLDE